MVEFEVVMDKLNGFETTEEIADYLHYRGIIGIPSSARSCAISEFVKQETGRCVVTDSHTVTIMLEDGIKKDKYLLISEPVKKFIYNFDHYRYTSLLK